MWRKRNSRYTVCGNANKYNNSGKQFGVFLKINRDLPYDSAILLLGIYPKECNTGYS
jgi:hypothetical protein